MEIENCSGSLLTETGCGECPKCIEEQKVLDERKAKKTDFKNENVFDLKELFEFEEHGNIEKWYPAEVFAELGITPNKYSFDLDEIMLDEARIFDVEAGNLKRMYQRAGYDHYEKTLDAMGVSIKDYEKDVAKLIKSVEGDDEAEGVIRVKLSKADALYHSYEAQAKSGKVDLAYKKVTAFWVGDKKVDLPKESWDMIPYKVREAVYAKVVAISSPCVQTFANL